MTINHNMLYTEENYFYLIMNRLPAIFAGHGSPYNLFE